VDELQVYENILGDSGRLWVQISGRSMLRPYRDDPGEATCSGLERPRLTLGGLRR
jgi:hypothetical protein